MPAFYAWFPGDYIRDTLHLSMVEDAAYRRILDHYYMTERVPSPAVSDSATAAANAEVLLRVCRAITREEQDAVRKVAAEFFEERDGFLYLEKVEHEIARSRAVSAQRSAAGRTGAAKTNSRKAANAAAPVAANAAAPVAANAAAPVQQPIPTVYTVSKDTVTALPSSSPSDPKKALFDLGVSILTKTGDTEKTARSFIAKFAKQDEGKLGEVLGHLAAHPKVEPKSYIVAAFKPEARGLVI